jgi:hypothetical protein
MLQMSSMMREGGMNPFGGGGGAGGFPAPGNPGGFPAPGTPGNASTPSNLTPASAPAQGIAPFANMFGPAGAGGGGGGAGFDPAMMQQLFGMGAGTGGAVGGTPNPSGTGNPFGAFGGGAIGGGAATSVPADTRSPEERFQVQLQVRSLTQVLYDCLTSFSPSNSMTWVSRTHHRMSALYLRLPAMCMGPLNIFWEAVGCRRYIRSQRNC